MLRLSLPAIPTIFKTPRCLPLHLVASPRLPSLSYRFPSSSCSFSSICSAYAEPNQNSAAAEVDDDEEESGFDEELRKLLALLPEGMRKRAGAHPELHQLVEIVMDLGRRPLARFPSGDFVLSDDPITLNDLHHATSQAGDFTADNRAGISRTLHRISAIKNRKGAIIGLTCRVGRAVSGSANLLRDLIEDGASLLLIGPPGVGKTTVIREVGRMLADDLKKRVMIVDTSNEIGGDGDVPHAGIGSARRMQVPNPDLQHRVLIEAVENHMPQVIVIDEIGTRLEAAAASTIAQRGIQLIASAHGVTIENLTMNPSLEMLVGGVQSVTLGDDEASRRGVQKTVLERKGPATFSCAVEIVSKTEMRVHHSLEATVDALLSGRPPSFEIRTPNSLADIIADDSPYDDTSAGMVDDEESLAGKASIRVYTYGILEKSIIQAITKLRLDELVQLTDGIGEANALLALQSKLKKNTPILTAAKSQGTPVYTIKTCSLPQISKVLRVIVAELNDPHRRGSPEEVEALEEARLAVEQVVIPMGRPMDLLPRSAHVVAAQIELVREYGLSYEEVGEEPNAHHLRVLPIHWEISSSLREDVEAHNGVPRLPLLPE